MRDFEETTEEEEMGKWKDLPEDEHTPENWEKRTNWFCPFTSPPCVSLIDKDGPDEPENALQCRFYSGELGKCELLMILKDISVYVYRPHGGI
jgi:hypothetical protein